MNSPFALEHLRRDALPILTLFVVTTAVSFFAWGDAFDNHWTSSWVLLSLVGVLLSAASAIRLARPKLWGVGMAVLVVQAWRGGQAQWEVLGMWVWLWTWLWTVPDKQSWLWRGVKALPLFAAIFGTLMLIHAVKSMAVGQWGHGQTYVMTLPWAHRNIGMEALFAMAVLGGQISRQRWWRWWLFITTLALVYQVRGVLLASAFWLAYEAWVSGLVSSKLGRATVVAVGVFVAAQVAWNVLPESTRVREFKRVPDTLKSLDITYNLKAAESSTIRWKLWEWTCRNATALGGGLGSWREDAEGHVNVALGRCQEATRRAHSELLQWTYELGWIPALMLLALCWPWRHALLRWGGLVLPFLAFTFPMERAEILWAFAVLGWWFKPDASDSLGVLLDRRLPLVVFSTVALALGAWSVSQNAMGRTLRQSGTIHVRWSPTEKFCVNLFPIDIALNPASVVRAMGAYNKGNPELGMSLLEGHLESHPRSVPAIKVWLKATGRPYDPDAVCDHIRAIQEK